MSILPNLPFSNINNSHDSASFSSNTGAVAGFTGSPNSVLALQGKGVVENCPMKGGKKKLKKTKKVSWKGWSKIKPKGKQLTTMFKRCGKKCFLGKRSKHNKSHPNFPICKKKTCKISTKGLSAAYIRSKQWGKRKSQYKKSKPKFKKSFYNNVSKKAKKMLKKRGITIGKTRKMLRQKGGSGTILSYNYSTGAPLPNNMSALANPAPYHAFKNDC